MIVTLSTSNGLQFHTVVNFAKFHASLLRDFGEVQSHTHIVHTNTHTCFVRLTSS